MKNLLIKTSSGLKFLGLVIIAYIILLLLNPPAFFNSVNAFIAMIIKISPILILVFSLIFIINLVLDSRKILEKISKEDGILGYLFFIIFGIVSAGPIYMWYPLLADLKEKGVKNSLIVTFLYNRAVKLPLIPIMIYYFGLKFVIILSLLMVIFSVINGLLVDKFLTQKQ